ncbi:hypothetical protein IKE67_08670 [bacterium]|nr:hypothetical protein [bacterium]
MDRKFIICDIDGVLIDTSWIWGFVQKYPIKDKSQVWDFFNRNCNAAINGIDKVCSNFVKNLAQERECGIYFLTARSERVALETREVLRKRLGFDVSKCNFSFRKESDNESSVVSKQNRLKLLKNLGYEFEVAIDDDRNICDMYSRNGIETVINWQLGSIPTGVVALYAQDDKLNQLLRG